MEFRQDFTVPVPAPRVWAFLWDVQQVAACIPGCREARIIEPHKHYEAVIAERIGPFKVTFPLQIEVLEADEPRRLRVAATGKDNALGTSLKMLMDLQLVDAGNGATQLAIRMDVTVLGKLASLGHSMIMRKADGVTTEFAAALRKALVEVPSNAPTL